MKISHLLGAGLIAIAAMSSTASAGDYDVTGTIGSTFNVDPGHEKGLSTDLAVGRAVNKNLRVDANWTRSEESNGDVGAIELNAFTANGYLVFDEVKGFTPFVGYGLGYGWASGNGVHAVSDSGLVHGPSIGASYDLSDKWTLVGTVRRLESSDISVKDNAGSYDNFDNTSAKIGLRYQF